MDETGNSNHAINYVVCQGCLDTKNNVKKTDRNISSQFKKMLKMINFGAILPEEVRLCVYCTALMKKIIKFIKQCEEINYKYFVLSMNEIFRKPSDHYFNLSQNDITILSYPIKVEDEQTTGYDEFTYDDEYDDVPLIDLKNIEIKEEENLDLNDFYAQETKYDENDTINLPENYTLETDAPIDIEPKNYNGIKLGHNFNKKRKLKRKHSKKISKQDLRNGFSKRMVQETEEYVVIKLSKQQVADELCHKSQLDSFKCFPYKCDMCVLGFNFEETLQNHMKKHSKENGEMKCDICKQYWSKGVSFRGHMKTHTTRYKCKVCGDIYRVRQNLLGHYQNEHTSESKIYKCEICDFFTCNRTTLHRHGQTHSAEFKYSCDQCGKVLKNKSSLRIHILRHNKDKLLKCTECIKVFSNQSFLNEHMLQHHMKKQTFLCIECNVEFKNRVSLQTHYKKSKAHNPDFVKTFSCKNCNLVFNSKSVLLSHLLNIHGQDERVACTVCHRKMSASSLKSHHRNQHTDYVKPSYTCTLCGKVFKGRSVLSRHMTTHTGERPYSCPECDASFGHPSTRYNHIQIVHRKIPKAKKSVKMEEMGLEKKPECEQ